MVVGGDREQHGQYGAGPGRAVHGHGAADGLHPVPQAGQARPAAGVGAARAVVAGPGGPGRRVASAPPAPSSRTWTVSVPPACSMRMSTAEAAACLAALVNAS